MAAAGLRPQAGQRSGRPSNASHVSSAVSFGLEPPLAAAAPVGAGLQLQTDDQRHQMSQQKQNLLCMVQFASSLMEALNSINKQSFQVFKLRVGLNSGSVVAGIVGAQRPFYDIWGDCVNVSLHLALVGYTEITDFNVLINRPQIASRMESLGQVGRIQVEEKTAKLLAEATSCAEGEQYERACFANQLAPIN